VIIAICLRAGNVVLCHEIDLGLDGLMFLFDFIDANDYHYCKWRQSIAIGDV